MLVLLLFKEVCACLKASKFASGLALGFDVTLGVLLNVVWVLWFVVAGSFVLNSFGVDVDACSLGPTQR